MSYNLGFIEIRVSYYLKWVYFPPKSSYLDQEWKEAERESLFCLGEGGGITYHLLAQLHGRRERFWVSSQDVAKVDMDEVSCLWEEKVVQVSVAHSQQVGDHTVASYRRRESGHKREKQINICTFFYENSCLGFIHVTKAACEGIYKKPSEKNESTHHESQYNGWIGEV